MAYLLLLIITGACQLKMVLSSQQCACASVNVHVRDGAGANHHILGILTTNHCLRFKNHHMTDNHGASWANVDYRNKDGWIHENFIHMSTMTACSGNHSLPSTTNSVQLPGCPKIITRHEWHARSPKWVIPKLTQIPKYMFIHHGATAPCFTQADCIHKVQAYQNYHMDTHEWPDIGYSFVVGEDGNVYEARGWNEVGAHTYGYNNVGLAICIIGDFTHRTPNSLALDAVKQLINCTYADHKLTSDYLLRGHRDVVNTGCPGDKLYQLVQTWPHY